MDNYAKLPKKKWSAGKKTAAILTGIVLALALVAGGIYLYFELSINEGEAGKLTPEVQTTDTINAKDVEYILVCGIDDDAEDASRSGVGRTDLIMLVCYDRKDGAMSILQIPRDTYVGEEVPTGSTGKINGVYSHGADTKSRISNLAKVINDQFKLPIDHYVTIDMQHFREIINVLGGIQMYVPWDVPYFDEAGNQIGVIAEGDQLINGSQAEIIVRSRKGYAQGDIKRLQTQQYFFAALFRTMKTFPMSDIIKVAPGFINYFNTDYKVSELVNLMSAMQKMDSAKIGFTRCPGGGLGKVNGHSGMYGINPEVLAPLLNDHFRPYSDPVPASELGLPTGLAYAYGEIPGEYQSMGDLKIPAK